MSAAAAPTHAINPLTGVPLGRTGAVQDTMPGIVAAGTTSMMSKESAAICLQPSIRQPELQERPSTPENIKKYRRTYQQQPGLKFIHPGLTGQNLPPSHIRYGVQTSLGERAGDALVGNAKTELGSYLHEQKESIYRSKIREPLGHTYKRGYAFPEKYHQKNFRFGMHTSSSESAKNLIYYNTDQEGWDEKRQRGRNDGPQEVTNRDITRQVNRNYDWAGTGVDPNTTRFGVLGEPLVEGVKKSLTYVTEVPNTVIGSLQVQQSRYMKNDPLGAGKPVKDTVAQLPPDFAFGKVGSRDKLSAKDIIQGSYTPDELRPDRDLGISLRKLDKLPALPADPGRTYGVPSIRDDVPRPKMKSVADTMNYGDESDAQGLLYPSRFAYDGIDAEDFMCERTPNEIAEIFERIGQTFSQDEFSMLIAAAVRDYGGLSVESFRQSLNRSRNERICNACNAVLCQHEFCIKLPCRHDGTGNHTSHATNSKRYQSQAVQPNTQYLGNPEREF